MPSQLLDRLSKLEKAAASLKKTVPTTTKSNAPTPKPSDVFGLPNARTGESPLTSRGFEICRMAKAMLSSAGGHGNWDDAKVERDVIQATQKAYAGATNSFTAGAVQVPLSTEYMAEGECDPVLVAEIKQKMYTGSAKADPDEMRWLVTKYMPPGRKEVYMSWLDQTFGGSLVAPPVQGELIDLFRNEECLVQAGCRQMPMPPSGLSLPRQTSATTAGWVGENRDNSSLKSVVGTGELKLGPKKAFALVPMPNDLLRYAGPAAEMLVRTDVMKTMALVYDLAALEGVGSALKPNGLINTQGISTVTPTTVATDGNTLSEQDLYKFQGALEAKNAKFEGFIMHPNLYYALIGRRNDAVTANDKKGAFTFSPIRDMADGPAVKRINGMKTIVSNQVSTGRSKGNSGATLTYVVAGMFSDVILSLLGAMEFAVATQGDTTFASDQTMLRAILIGDVGVRHAASIAWADQLVVA
jgi:HK97 family phage major capsid protein